MRLSRSRRSESQVNFRIASLPLIFAAAAFCQAPKGLPVNPSPDEVAAQKALTGKANGFVVWSSSREGNHKIYAMSPDGSDFRKLTQGNKTDWYPRISPDGKQVLFTRSKLDWTAEVDANYPERWDTWTVGAEGGAEKLLIPNSTWATWTAAGKIVFARGMDVFECSGDGTGEKKIIDGKTELKGGIAQNPSMSSDGKLVALTLRGSQRSVGIFNLEKRTWFESASGGGCQMSFFPGGHRVVRVNPTGNGGTELYAYNLDAEGRHGNLPADQQKWIDLPGRRSHEYFPRISMDGKWLIWGATDRGHDHDIADYEVELLKIGEPATKTVRLTFHTGNDRWPDIWVK
jgi:hypothetical protein